MEIIKSITIKCTKTDRSGLLSNIFSIKDCPEFDCGLLDVDMHSHLIPGIDDGVQNMAESINIISIIASLIKLKQTIFLAFRMVMSWWSIHFIKNRWVIKK